MIKMLCSRLWLAPVLVMLLPLALSGCGRHTSSSTSSTPTAAEAGRSTVTSIINPSPTTESVIPETTAAASPAADSSTPAGLPVSSTTAAITSTAMPAPTIAVQDLIDNIKSAWAKLTSYQYSFDLNIKMTGSIGGKDQGSSIEMTATSVNNVLIQESQMNGTMNITSAGEGKMSIPVTGYYVNGWEYTEASLPFAGTEWMKIKLDPASYAAQDDAQHNLALLQSAVNTAVSGTEDINGVTCYAVQVTPDPTEFSKWMKSFQQSTSETGSATTSLDLTKYISNLAITEYVAEDSYLLEKTDFTFTVSLSGSDLGSTAQASDNLNMNVDEEVSLTNVNQTVSIVLPPESQNAKDITPQQ